MSTQLASQMMMTTSTLATSIKPAGQNLLFSTYGHAGPSLALISSAVAINLAGLPGIVGNAFLCLVTSRNSSLRGTSNQLLAWTALFEVLHQTAHFPFLAVAISGLNFIPYQLSVYLQLHSIFGVTAAQMAMLLTALDRLVAVSMPLLHTQISGTAYLSTLVALCFLAGGYFVALALQSAGSHWNMPVTGSIGDLFIDQMQLLFMYILAVGLLNILLYVIVWIVVKAKTFNSTAVADRNARLFRSLVLIICVVLGGYLLNNLVRLVFVKAFVLDDVQVWFLGTYSGVLLNIGASAEVPILYLFSTDYRKLFNHEGKRILGLAKGSIRVFTTHVAHTNVVNHRDIGETRSENGRRRVGPV